MSEGHTVGSVDVRPWLAPERAALVELLASLSEDDWKRPTECPAWDVHGIALHVLGDDLSLLSRQRDIAPNGLLLYAADHPGLGFRELLDGFNDQWVATARFFGHRLTIELLRAVGELSDAFYAAQDPATIGEPVGFFGARSGSPYWQIIGREYVERFTHHQQIRRALGHDALDASLLAPVLDVVMRAISMTMPSCGADVGDRWSVQVTGLTPWTLERGGERWSLVKGDAQHVFSLGPDLAATLFSRGVAPSDVAGALAPNSTLTRVVAGWLATVLGRPVSA